MCPNAKRFWLCAALPRGVQRDLVGLQRHARCNGSDVVQTLLRGIAIAAAAIGLAVTAERPAHAFELSSAVTAPCHEKITMEALRAARLDRPGAGPLGSSRDERALIDDVPFDLDSDMQDLGAVTLLVGVRDNDLKGRGPTEVDQLALVHGDPAFQREHCLRPLGASEPNGSERALRECREFILQRMGEAIDGLDAAGLPDPTRRTSVEVELELRGRVDATLPTFFVKLGQAMHTLQDGFSHTYRTPDGSKVTVVLDWLRFVQKDHVEQRDGPAHLRSLDQCEEPDALHQRNRRLAVEASTELVRIALEPGATKEAKLRSVDALLAKHLSYEPGCNADNRWCNAAENTYAENAGCGCSLASSRRDVFRVVIAALTFTLAVARRRSRRARAASAAALVVAVVQTESPASPDAPPEEEKQEKPASRIAPVTPVEQEQALKEVVHTSSPFAVAAGFGGSIVDPGMAVNAGMRLRLSDRIVLGLDGEINWWYGVQTSTLRMGAVNVYGSFIARWPLRFEPLNLRTTAQLGTAIQTLDLYGVPSGSVGLFAALYPLGIEWKLSRAFYLIGQPLGVALPVPQLTGAPFAYPQFRTMVALELSF